MGLKLNSHSYRSRGSAAFRKSRVSTTKEKRKKKKGTSRERKKKKKEGGNDE